MSKLTPKQMAEIIRKGGTLGNGFLRKVVDTLDEIDGVGYQQFMRLVAENDRLRKELIKAESVM